jgi:hypothetical protein
MAQITDILGNLVNSPRKQRRFLIVSAAVFTVGVTVFVAVVVLGGTANRFTDTISNIPAQLNRPDPKTPISKDELALARRFIKTAVLRQDLASSYDLVNADLKGTMTRKQWTHGNIPVVSYEATNADRAGFTVDYSNQRSAMLEVDLIAKAHTETRPHLLFFLGLHRAGDKATGRWLVNYWAPHYRPPIPMAPG